MGEVEAQIDVQKELIGVYEDRLGEIFRNSHAFSDFLSKVVDSGICTSEQQQTASELIPKFERVLQSFRNFPVARGDNIATKPMSLLCASMIESVSSALRAESVSATYPAVNLSVQKAEFDRISVAWEGLNLSTDQPWEAAHPTVFELQVRREDGGFFTTVYKGTDTSFRYRHLAPDTEYTFRVRAIEPEAKRVGTWSKTASARTRAYRIYAGAFRPGPRYSFVHNDRRAIHSENTLRHPACVALGDTTIGEEEVTEVRFRFDCASQAPVIVGLAPVTFNSHQPFVPGSADQKFWGIDVISGDLRGDVPTIPGSSAYLSNFLFLGAFSPLVFRLDPLNDTLQISCAEALPEPITIELKRGEYPVPLVPMAIFYDEGAVVRLSAEY